MAGATKKNSDSQASSGDVKGIRHRFAVPEADTICNEWCDLQSNLGFSLRVLIKAYVAVNGMSDAACMMNVVVPKRGRKPKKAEELIQLPFKAVSDTDIQFAQESYDAKDMYRADVEGTKVDANELPAETVSAKQVSQPQSEPQHMSLDMMSQLGPGVATKITSSADTDDDDTDDLMNM